MAPKHGSSELPLRHRLLWRDPLSAETLISADRGLMACTFGTLALVSAVLGVLMVVINAKPRDHTIVWIIVAIELAIASVCFGGYRRLPIWSFHAMLAVAIVCITLSAIAEPVAGQGVMALYVLWVVLLAGLFFGGRAALAYTAIAVAGFSAVLFAKGNPYAPNFAVGTAAAMASAGLVVGLLRARLEQLATDLGRDARTDTVTGLLNRRGFNERCDAELARAARDGLPISVVVCDIDHFKRVNDEFGHERGDVALRTAAWAMRSSVRLVDVVGRLGGEEFGIVLPGADQEAALTVADRVREKVRTTFADNPVSLTVSCGVATVGETEPRRDALLRAADRALYEAKGLGRDRSVVAPAPKLPALVPAQAVFASSTK
jgi:diguanylate cyclase (GGDEF)-like protein